MLQELCNLASREKLVGDTAFEVRPIAWVIQLKANGDFLNFAGTHEAEPVSDPKKGAKAKKPKEFAKKFTIPRQFNPDTGGTRTSGDYAYFLVDKSDYVLGCALETKSAQPPTDSKLIKRHQLFISKVKACYEETKDEKLKAVLVFLNKIHVEGLPVDLPEKTAPGDLYGFVVRPDVDEFVHDLPSVQQFWREYCSSKTADGEAEFVCLITGKPITETLLFPQVKRVPGAQASSGLVSFEMQASRSHGWDKTSNATVSAEAAQAAVIAMNRLLDPAYQTQEGAVLQKRHIRISEDTIACFWAKEADGDEVADGLPAALQADTGGKPGHLWQSVWSGKPPAHLDPSKFYAVTLTGAQGRTIVRNWYETTVGEVQVSLSKYFAQLELRPNTRPGKEKPLPPQFALRTLQECLVASRKADDLPSKYAADLFAASINQYIRFPSSLLSIALERMKAEIGRNDWIDSYRRDARTGLIKAILMRNHDQLNLTATMDDKNEKSGYLLGRLFACIERMQYLALDQVNSNLANRYFAAASSTPLLIFVNLEKGLEQHYLKKALRRKPKSAKWVYSQILEIKAVYNKVRIEGQSYPSRLSTVDQGLFMIGYHVQKGSFMLPKDKDSDAPDSE
ncbi:MAG: type I-C CRISPR-associated protein Cas8c/Csd1, partial [Proteobacteria bacterium]